MSDLAEVREELIAACYYRDVDPNIFYITHNRIPNNYKIENLRLGTSVLFILGMDMNAFVKELTE